MTKKEFNQLMLNTFGRTRAEWQMYENGTAWDGSLYRKSNLFDVAKPNKTYCIVPYYGGLYQNKIDAFGKELIIKIK